MTFVYFSNDGYFGLCRDEGMADQPTNVWFQTETFVQWQRMSDNPILQTRNPFYYSIDFVVYPKTKMTRCRIFVDITAANRHTHTHMHSWPFFELFECGIICFRIWLLAIYFDFSIDRTPNGCEWRTTTQRETTRNYVSLFLTLMVFCSCDWTQLINNINRCKSKTIFSISISNAFIIHEIRYQYTSMLKTIKGQVHKHYSNIV